MGFGALELVFRRGFQRFLGTSKPATKVSWPSGHLGAGGFSVAHSNAASRVFTPMASRQWRTMVLLHQIVTQRALRALRSL